MRMLKLKNDMKKQNIQENTTESHYLVCNFTAHQFVSDLWAHKLVDTLAFKPLEFQWNPLSSLY